MYVSRRYRPWQPDPPLPGVRILRFWRPEHQVAGCPPRLMAGRWHGSARPRNYAGAPPTSVSGGSSGLLVSGGQGGLLTPDGHGGISLARGQGGVY